jgi:hypothetical protein
VPEGWSESSDEALAALCASATAKARRADAADTISAREPDAQVVSDLHAVEETLTEILDEVCDVPAVEKLDTGELIRVEETLAIAANAAREAISLRRKRRAQ